MAASKRSSYSQSNFGGDVVRNLCVIGGLGGLSFFLGFFVLGRMVPDKENAPGKGTKRPPDAQAVQVAQKPASSPASESAPSASEPIAPLAPQKSSESVVTIEPADETVAQKPRDFDTASGANKSDKVDKDKSPVGDATDGVTKETPDVVIPVGHASDSTAKTPQKTRKAHKPSKESVDATATSENGGIREGDQKPSKIDPDNSSDNHPDRSSAKKDPDAEVSSVSSRETSKESASAVSSGTPVRRTRYRVDAGAYARREAAEKVAQRVTDLGLEASVLPITKEDGTTVYRVQQGVYRKRSNADAAHKKLADAGLDTDVVKTGG